MEGMWFDRQGQPIDMMRWQVLHSDLAYMRVAGDTIGPYWVSTVWLGLNHQYGDGPPIIFETMVFLADTQELADVPFQDRYSTEEQAKRGHEEICTLIRATVQEDLPELQQEPKKEGC